jgi:hypothetical protein
MCGTQSKSSAEATELRHCIIEARTRLFGKFFAVRFVTSPQYVCKALVENTCRQEARGHKLVNPSVISIETREDHTYLMP